MRIKESMKSNVVSISDRATIKEAAIMIGKYHIGTLFVVDNTDKLVGVVTLHKLLSIVMPDFINLVEDFEFVHDFGAMKSRLPSPTELARPVSEVMTKPPIFVKENCSLLRANAIIDKHKIKDLAITNEDGKLIGMASHVDIGISIMKNWYESSTAAEEITP